MAKTMVQALADVGNGVGYLYITDSTGNLNPALTSFSEPEGLANIPIGYSAVMRKLVVNPPSNADTFAVGYMTLTNAAADNLTSLVIEGVGQISGPVAMVSGDLVASAKGIVDAINAYVSATDYTAVAVGASIALKPATPGDTHNGAVITPTFSGLSTATVSAIDGGRTASGYPSRVFIDADYAGAAVSTTLSGAAVEITEVIVPRSMTEPPASTEGTIASNTLSATRIANTQLIQVDGITTANNGLGVPTNEIWAINIEGAGYGDTFIITGKAGAVAPKVTSQTLIDIELSSVTLTGLEETLTLRYVGGGKYVQLVPEPVSVELLRANGVPVRNSAGIFSVAPAGGTIEFKPGITGTSGAGIVYESALSFNAGATLGSDLGIKVTSTTAIDNEVGYVYGNDQAIVLAGNAINLMDSGGVTKASIPEGLALAGNWTAKWEVTDAVAGRVDWTIGINYKSGVTKWLDGATLVDASVQDAAIVALNGSKLTAGTVPEAALTTSVQAKLNGLITYRKKISIGTVEVLTLNTSRVQAVGAYGVGTMIIPTKVVSKITGTGTPYTTNLTLQLIFDTAAEPVFEDSSLLARTVDGIIEIPVKTGVGISATQYRENEDLYFTVKTGDPAAGTGDTEHYLEYYVQTT